MSGYKATGFQLRVPPDAVGVPFHKWKRLIETPSETEIRQYLQAATVKPEAKPKQGKR